MDSINDRKTAFTEAPSLKTWDTSGSNMTTTVSFGPLPANRLGRALD
jgi:hypothetical protein